MVYNKLGWIIVVSGKNCKEVRLIVVLLNVWIMFDNEIGFERRLVLIVKELEVYRVDIIVF